MKESDLDESGRSLLKEMLNEPQIRKLVEAEIFRKLTEMRRRPTLRTDSRGPAGGPLG